MSHTSGLTDRLFAWRMSEVHPAFGHNVKVSMEESGKLGDQQRQPLRDEDRLSH